MELTKICINNHLIPGIITLFSLFLIFFYTFLKEIKVGKNKNEEQKNLEREKKWKEK